MTSHVSPLFDKLLAACNWQPGDGPIPGVFDKAPNGYKCAWSSGIVGDFASWGVTRKTLLRAQDFIPEPDAKQTQYEMADRLARGENPGTLEEMRSRDGTDYISPWHPKAPTLQNRLAHRPGWTIPQWADVKKGPRTVEDTSSNYVVKSSEFKRWPFD